MPVRIDETRNHQTTWLVDRSRLGASKTLGLFLTSDENNLARPNGHGFGSRVIGIARPDMTGRDDRVGGTIGFRSQNSACKLVGEPALFDGRHTVDKHVGQA